MESVADFKEQIIKSLAQQSAESFAEFLSSPASQEALLAYPELLVYSRHHHHMSQIDYSFIQDDSLLSQLFHPNNFSLDNVKKLLLELVEKNQKPQILESVLDYLLSEKSFFNVKFQDSPQTTCIIDLTVDSLISNPQFEALFEEKILKTNYLPNLLKELNRGDLVDRIFSSLRGVEAQAHTVIKKMIVSPLPYNSLINYDNQQAQEKGFTSTILYSIGVGHGEYTDNTLKNYLNKYQNKITTYDNRGKNIAWHLRHKENAQKILQSYGLEPARISSSYSFKKLLNPFLWGSHSKSQIKKVSKKTENLGVVGFIEAASYKIKIFAPDLQNEKLTKDTKNVLLKALGLMSLLKDQTYNEDTHFLKHDVLNAFFNNAKEINDILKTSISSEEKDLIYKSYEEQLALITDKIETISSSLLTNIAATKINELHIQNKVLSLKAYK